MTAMTEDDMRLPKGKTCSDCYAFKFCVGLFGCKPTNTTCDWAPSRFYQKKSAEEQTQ